MGIDSRAKKISLWDLEKLRKGLTIMKDIYYNYDQIVSFMVITIIEKEIKERVGDYESIQELYGRNEERSDRPLQ